MNLESVMTEKVRGAVNEDGDLVWILVYDFPKVRENKSKVRKFYRDLKKLESGRRRTNSELIFDKFEDALMVKELALSCGAIVVLYGGVEVSSDLSREG